MRNEWFVMDEARSVPRRRGDLRVARNVQTKENGVILSERSESKDLIPRQARPYPAWKILRLRRKRLRSG